MQHLERIGCEIMDIKSDPGIAEAIHSDIRDKPTCLTENMNTKYQAILDTLMAKITKTFNVYSFLEFYEGVFLPKEAVVEWTESLERRISTASLQQVGNISQLCNYVIDSSSESETLKGKFELALIFLALAQKGLTSKEVLILTKLSESEWRHFLSIFGCIIVKY